MVRLVAPELELDAPLETRLAALEKVVATSTPATHSVAGALSFDLSVAHRFVRNLTANVTDHTWTSASTGDTVVIEYLNASTTDVVTVDMAAGFVYGDGFEGVTVELNPEERRLAVAYFFDAGDPVLLSTVVLDPGVLPPSATTQVEYDASWTYHNAASSDTSVVVGSITGASGKAALMVVTGTGSNTAWTGAAAAGWTSLGHTALSTWGTVEAFTRSMDGTASDTPTVTGSTIKAIGVFTWGGGDAAAIDDGAGWAVHAAATSHDPANATPLADGAAICSVLVSRFSPRTWSQPSGMTLTYAGADGERDLVVGHYHQTTAGLYTTGTFDETSGNGSSDAATCTFIIPATV